MTKPIESGWEKYRREVLPADASRVQVEETRKGFYSGAWCLWSAVMGSLDAGAEPSAADLLRLDELHAELKDYAAAVAEAARKGSSRS